MASYSDKIEWWADWRCDTTKMQTVPFPGTDRIWSLPVADASVPAWLQFIDLMNKHDYKFRESAGGTYNCRKIANSNSWSLHAFGIAVDLNPSVNRYGQHSHDYPQGFIDDVLATGMFKWGQDFDDPMHWEIDVPPEGVEGEDMAGLTQEDLDKIGQLIDERLKLVTLDNGKRISYVALDSTWNVPHGGRLMKDNVVDARKAAEDGGEVDAEAVLSQINLKQAS